MTESERILKANSPEGTQWLEAVEPDPRLHPSPMKLVRVVNSAGAIKVVAMNRRQRRHLKIYN